MAVYTQIPPEVLAAFLDDYDLGPARALTGIAEGVENSNFLLETAAGRFILTLFERRTRADELPWFLALTRHLAERGVPCPLPVAARDGQALRRLCDRAAVIVTFLPGAWPRAPDAGHCAAVGAALAGLHRAGADFAARRENALGPDGWAPLLAACPAACGVEPGLGPELERRLAGVLGAWPEGLPKGPIHGDLFPDNVFFEGGAVSGLIDFYFAATDFLAYDLAVCLTSWCFGPDGAFHDGCARAVTAGYASVRPLTGAEARALPVLIQGASLRFLLTRLYDWTHTPADALVTRKDPMEFVRRLRTQAGLGADAYLG